MVDKEHVKELALIIPKNANVGNMGASKFSEIITKIIDHTDELIEMCPILSKELYIKDKKYCPLRNHSRAGQATALQFIRNTLWKLYYSL